MNVIRVVTIINAVHEEVEGVDDQYIIQLLTDEELGYDVHLFVSHLSYLPSEVSWQYVVHRAPCNVIADAIKQYIIALDHPQWCE